MMIMIMANTKFQTSSITISFKGGSQCDVHRLVLPSFGQHRQLRQGAAILQGCPHPHLNHSPVVFMLILIVIRVHQFINNSSARLSFSSILIPFSPSFPCSSSSWSSSSCSSLLINPSQEQVLQGCLLLHHHEGHPHLVHVLLLILVDQLIKSIIISFLISLFVTIISWCSQS